MQDIPERGLSLLSAMVLIALTAPGLALTRGLPEYIDIHEQLMINNRVEVNSAGGWSLHSPGIVFTPAGRPLRDRPSYWLGHIPYWAAPCLASWSIAIVVLGLRSRLSAGSPGLAAGLALVVALAVQLIRCLRYASADGRSLALLRKYPDPFLCYFWADLPRLTGYTVAVWWLAFRLSGSPSREPGAVGRLGYGLGWCWIAMGLASELAPWCYALNH